MTDITKCSGGKCPLKSNCRRHIQWTDKLFEWSFDKPPYRVRAGIVSCKMFYGDKARMLLDQLKSIVNGK